MSLTVFRDSVSNLTRTVDACVSDPVGSFWAINIRTLCRLVLDANFEDLGEKLIDLLDEAIWVGNPPTVIEAIAAIEEAALRLPAPDVLLELEAKEGYVYYAEETLEEALYLASLSPFGEGCPDAWERYYDARIHADSWTSVGVFA